MKRVLTALALAPFFGAFALTTNVSTVAELAAAIQYLNERHTVDELILKPGTYPVDEFNLQYYHTTYKCWTNSNAHIGLTKFTMRGETGNPADVVICLTNATSDVGLLYSYTATIRDLTISNCTCSARSACANVNGNSNYSNVVVTCCSSDNGGAANSGTWRDCRFVNCSGKLGGAVYGSNARLYGCMIEDCTATTDGGASHAAVLVDCTIRNCSSRTGGGAHMGALTNCWVEGCSAEMGGGLSKTVAYGCTVTNCSASVYAGGVYNMSGVVRDCAIVGNASEGSGGGAYQCSLSNCLVACNSARVYGGGVFGDSSGNNRSNYVLTDCVVSNNVLNGEGMTVHVFGGGVACATVLGGRVTMNRVTMDDEAKEFYSYGGGTAFCVVQDALIDGNAMTGVCKNFQGGGDYGSTLTRCTVANNISATLGSGICGSTAEACVISNNASLAATAAIRQCKMVKGCTVYGCSLDPQGPLVDTRIIGYTNGVVIAKGANVLTQEAETHYPGTPHLVTSRGAFTNCLFTGQRMLVKYCSLFAATKNYETILSSCTLAGNCVEYTHSGFQESTKFTAVNCVFSDNYMGDGETPSDMRTSYPYLQFDHCLIKALNGKDLDDLIFDCPGCITNRSAKFVFSGDEPFLLKAASPARGAGRVEEWMADATDIRGEGFARLTGGSVNMGCFEGFVPSKGTRVIVR